MVFSINDSRRLNMLCDFYELTMANGYFVNGDKEKNAVYDLYYRENPDKGGFSIFAGLQQIIEYVENLNFNDEDIIFLRNKNLFDEAFLDYLRNFKFECDVWSVPEGTPVFANEPLMTIRGPIIQCQLLETMFLVIVNHQSLIATKANRIVRAAKGRRVLEFGARRAQGVDSANYGARAAYIAGVDGTSNTFADYHMQIPAGGTMAHSWIQSFDSEYEAFATYAKIYPNATTLLVDTYNTLKSGIPNAIKVAKEVLEPQGYRLKGVRLDSGDIAYLSKKCREMLDKENMQDCEIVVSNSMDEYIIQSLLYQEAKVDVFGVGENLITAKSNAVFGGVYKLVAVYDKKGELVPKIKVSENIIKVSTPSLKKLYRLYDKKTNKAIADVICLHDEVINADEPYIIFDPIEPSKRKTVTNFYAKELQQLVYKNGKLVYELLTIEQIRKYCSEQIDTLWEEILRFQFPHKYYVDLSYKLWCLKELMFEQNR